MIADFSGFLAERLGEELRYSDAGIAPAKRAGEIDALALQKIGQTLRDSLTVDASLLRGWFGAFITRYRAAHEAIPRRTPLSAADFARRLNGGASLIANPWSRLAWSKEGFGAMLFVAGESHRCPRALAEKLCHRAPLLSQDMPATGTPGFDLLLNLVNRGHLALGRTRSER
jgi:50S ribosomal protein L16 3-hydroxylase